MKCPSTNSLEWFCGAIPTTFGLHTMSILLPGQPIALPKGPTLRLGAGTYVREGKPRASLVGTLQSQAGVSRLSVKVFMNASPTAWPTFNSEHIGTIHRTNQAPSSSSSLSRAGDDYPIVPSAGFTVNNGGRWYSSTARGRVFRSYPITRCSSDGEGQSEGCRLF